MPHAVPPTHICTIPGCTRPRPYRLWCAFHYERWLKHGSAEWEPSPRPSEAERFWAKVNKTETCWLWTAATAKGYGTIMIWRDGLKKMIPAHRLSWEMHNGPIPDGLQVLHHCDVRPCVRPEHLFLGTQKDNIHDMWVKGRAIKPPRWKGGPPTNAKLTQEDVEKIRARYAAGGIFQRELAAEYGISQSAVHLIVTHQRWLIS